MVGREWWLHMKFKNLMISHMFRGDIKIWSPLKEKNELLENTSIMK